MPPPRIFKYISSKGTSTAAGKRSLKPSTAFYGNLKSKKSIIQAQLHNAIKASSGEPVRIIQRHGSTPNISLSPAPNTESTSIKTDDTDFHFTARPRSVNAVNLRSATLGRIKRIKREKAEGEKTRVAVSELKKTWGMKEERLRGLETHSNDQITPMAEAESGEVALETLKAQRFFRPAVYKSWISLDIGEAARNFSTSSTSSKGLSPETEEPEPRVAEQQKSVHASTPAELSNEKYNALSDDYLDILVEKLEELQEETEEVDVEYSAGVLTLVFPPNGTYVINKQPPNKQIWLSSPISGPKRYDYVLLSEGQDSKEGTGRGEWVYLRDGSTLTVLLREECGVDMTDLSHRES